MSDSDPYGMASCATGMVVAFILLVLGLVFCLFMAGMQHR